MSQPIVLPDVDSLRAFMRGMSAVTRARGEAYFKRPIFVCCMLHAAQKMFEYIK